MEVMSRVLRQSISIETGSMEVSTRRQCYTIFQWNSICIYYFISSINTRWSTSNRTKEQKEFSQRVNKFLLVAVPWLFPLSRINIPIDEYKMRKKKLRLNLRSKWFDVARHYRNTIGKRVSFGWWFVLSDY